LPPWLTLGLPHSGANMDHLLEEASQMTSRKELRVPVLTEEELQRLKDGERVERQQVEEGGIGSGYVAVDVDAPSRVVMDCLADFAGYAEMIPTVRDVRVHARGLRDDGETWARCTYQLSKFRLEVGVVQSVDKRQNVVRFDIDPKAGGMVLKKASGFWLVEQLPGDSNRCRVWLGVDVVACKLLPCWLIDYAAKRALPRATAWLKPHVEALLKLSRQSDRSRSVRANAFVEPQPPRARQARPVTLQLLHAQLHTAATF